MIGDGHGFSHGCVAVQTGVLARCHRDMGEIFAGGAGVVHMALRGKGMIGDGREIAPRFLPMFVAVANGGCPATDREWRVYALVRT